jgi:hypothetical protein
MAVEQIRPDRRTEQWCGPRRKILMSAQELRFFSESSAALLVLLFQHHATSEMRGCLRIMYRPSVRPQLLRGRHRNREGRSGRAVLPHRNIAFVTRRYYINNQNRAESATDARHRRVVCQHRICRIRSAIVVHSNVCCCCPATAVMNDRIHALLSRARDHQAQDKPIA